MHADWRQKSAVAKPNRKYSTSASSVGTHFPSEPLFCWVGLFIFGLLLFAKPKRASDFYIYLFFPFFVNSTSHLFKPQIINTGNWITFLRRAVYSLQGKQTNSAESGWKNSRNKTI